MTRTLSLALALMLMAAPAALAAAAPKKPVDTAALMQQAQGGDAAAEVKIGNMYESGTQGLARDYVQAQQWYQKAADQGNLTAQYDLAMIYVNGRAGGKDFSKAVQLLVPPAEGGLSQAQYRLGFMMAHGLGVKFQDYHGAADWLTRAANQGDASAQNDLGDMYFYGQGVGLNYEDAYYWYLVSDGHKMGAKQQNTAQQKLARIKTALSPSQQQSAQQRAAAFKPVREPQAGAKK